MFLIALQPTRTERAATDEKKTGTGGGCLFHEPDKHREQHAEEILSLSSSLGQYPGIKGAKKQTNMG